MPQQDKSDCAILFKWLCDALTIWIARHVAGFGALMGRYRVECYIYSYIYFALFYEIDEEYIVQLKRFVA